MAGSIRIPRQRAASTTEPSVGNGAPVPASQARPPRVTWHVVERRSLLRRLSQTVDRIPLTLVCAPAGFGKTVLAADWALRNGRQRPVAWATMTERDTQPGVFWEHLRLALSVAGVPASSTATAPGAADVDALSVDLLRLAEPVVLVVDAAERLRERTVFDQLARLMDNAGERLRVLMTTRSDPPLPVHRYQVEGRVAEIRTEELALTRAEVGKVLAQHRLPASAELTEEVLRRTEGWAAGVRLAALQLQSDDDAPLDGFAADYLGAEVVDGLAPEERDVLVRCSLVAELPPGLPTALTDRSDADEVIRRLASGGALVQPVAGRPHVFRVHPLLRELMSAELDRVEPGIAAVLHRRAAEWFGAEGEAQLRSGDLDAACSALGGALVADADGPLRLRCLAELALAEACRGHLSRAVRLVDAAEQRAAEQEVPAVERPTASELTRAWVALERQDLAQAQRSLDHGARSHHVDAGTWATMTALLRARLLRDRGDGRGARRLLDQTGRPTGWLAHELAAEAAAVGLVDHREPDPRPPAPVTPAQRVRSLLERADAGCRAGRAGPAKVEVARALTLARSERLRRPFAHTSPRVRALMRNDAALAAKARWLRPEQLGAPHAPPAAPEAEPVHESLSRREMEVLRHLSALLTTEEIAAEMFISVNTVRTHVRRILEKLAVSRRNEAVRRARELGLV